MDQQSVEIHQRLAIIMPALNEEAVVGGQVRAILDSRALRALPVSEVIVVDNGSDDRTAEVARAAGARVVCEPEGGYGAACQAGALAAVGADVLLFMDADGSDDLDGAARVTQSLLDGDADLCVGSRARGHVESGALTVQQRWGNAVATGALRALYHIRLSDLSPVKAIRRADLLALEPRERTYGWTTEILVKAARAGYRIRETPVDYHRRAGGDSKVSGSLSAGVAAGLSILATIGRYISWRPAEHREPTPARRDALVIVAKYPLPGSVKTRLGAGIGQAAAANLYRSFLLDLRQRFEATQQRDDYRLCWAYAPDLPSLRPILGTATPCYAQRGRDFAERLRNITRDIASLGYERVVILGSDSPHIAAETVKQAFTALDSHDVALGPAEDGGYYLIGLRLRPEPPDLFTRVRMSTATVLRETVERAREQELRVALLGTTFDVDEPADLERLRLTLEANEQLAPYTLAALRGLRSGAASLLPTAT